MCIGQIPTSHMSCPLWKRLICGYGSIPINTLFHGMNIHLPAILMFTRGTRFWHTAMCVGWSFGLAFDHCVEKSAARLTCCKYERQALLITHSLQLAAYMLWCSIAKVSCQASLKKSMVGQVLTFEDKILGTVEGEGGHGWPIYDWNWLTLGGWLP